MKTIKAKTTKECCNVVLDIPSDMEDELQEFRYIIPEGYEAEIVDGEVIIKKNEPELTEFEQNVRSCIVTHLTTRTKTADGGEISSTVFFSDATAREIAKELLDHAKKELCKGCVANLEVSDLNLMKEFNKGMQEAILWGREGYKVSPDGKVKSLTQDEMDSILEKQKESLHISETCKENADSFTDEDERIRKEIIDFIQWAEDRGMTRHDYHQAKRPAVWIAYLEKQKDINCLACDQHLKGYIAGRKATEEEKQKEQKPTSTEDMPYITDKNFYEREPVDSFKYKLAEYMTKCCTKKEGPYGYEYGISAETILKMAEEELFKRGVVQKPADDKAFEEWIDGWFKEHKEKAYPQITMDEKEFKNFCRGIRNMYEQKPAWSEEDERMRNLIIETLDDDSHYFPFKETKKKMMDWLKSLRPQPKKELSIEKAIHS